MQKFIRVESTVNKHICMPKNVYKNRQGDRLAIENQYRMPGHYEI